MYQIHANEFWAGMEESDDECYCPCGNQCLDGYEYCTLCIQGINCTQCGAELDGDYLKCYTCHFNPKWTSHGVKPTYIEVFGFELNVPPFLLRRFANNNMNREAVLNTDKARGKSPFVHR